MRIVIVNRFFWPDHSATSQLATDLAEHLAASGHEAVALASRQRYDDPASPLPGVEEHAGVTIRRLRTTRWGRYWLPGRALDYATFYVSCALALLRHAHAGSVILAKTDPPLISVVGAAVARVRGARLVTWQQDVFPEVAAALGMRWAAGPIGRILRGLRNRSLRAATLNVALNERMAEHLAGEGVPAERISVIANWCDEGIQSVAPDANPLRREWGLEGRFVIGYSGNLGRAHLSDAVAELVRRTWDLPNVAWVFIGGGPRLDRVRDVVAQSGATNVQFRPYQPRERLSWSLSLPDLHLVSLDPACEGLIMPSKLYGILAAGRPTAFLGDGDGAVARTVRAAGVGLVLEAAAPGRWRDELAAWQLDHAAAQGSGARARALHRSDHNKAASLNAWQARLAMTLEWPTAAPDRRPGEPEARRRPSAAKATRVGTTGPRV
ncbi:MAG: glycosyltransferase family 4 protein [Alphaproteobacteria bacterium]